MENRHVVEGRGGLGASGESGGEAAPWRGCVAMKQEQSIMLCEEESSENREEALKIGVW